MEDLELCISCHLEGFCLASPYNITRNISLDHRKEILTVMNILTTQHKTKYDIKSSNKHITPIVAFFITF